MKRLGKEGKDEGAKLEAEMEARHAAELASLAGDREKTVAEAVAVADSLYSVHLGDEEQGEQQHKVWRLRCTEPDRRCAEQRGQVLLCRHGLGQMLSLKSVRPPACPVQKASKGQRRREQRQREEQEREARIQAELAELGDTGRLGRDRRP